MSPFGLKFSQMILHTETSKLMYNWSFLFVVLHKPTLLPSTFKISGLETVLYVAWSFLLDAGTSVILLSICKLHFPLPPPQKTQYINTFYEENQ